ncbi:MAG: MFS transporter [Elusimicrobia bacterium]|nr:MFS transporter [Elusimicrobiota bacterium]
MPLAAEIWTLCVCQALLSAGVSLAFPFLSIYLCRERGLAMSAVGAWLSLSVLVTAFSHGLGGELSDVLGRRRVMVLSLWSRAATILVLAAAIKWRWPFPALMAVHLTSSFLAHFFDPAARSWVADHAGPQERQRAYGLLRVATNAGFAAGPAAGGLLVARSYAFAFAASAVVCVLCAALVTLVLKDQAGAARSERFQSLGVLRATADPLFLRLCVLNLVISVAMAQLVVTLSVFSSQFLKLDASAVGLLFSLNGLLVVLMQVPATKVLAGMRLTSAVALGCVMYAAGYAAVGFSHGLAGLVAAMAVITFGEVLVPPGVHTMGANMAPARARGRYLGLLGISHQAGSALGPLTGGLGLEYVSSRWAPGHWLAVAAVALGASVAFFRLAKELSPSEQGQAEGFIEEDVPELPAGA